LLPLFTSRRSYSASCERNFAAWHNPAHCDVTIHPSYVTILFSSYCTRRERQYRTVIKSSPCHVIFGSTVDSRAYCCKRGHFFSPQSLSFFHDTTESNHIPQTRSFNSLHIFHPLFVLHVCILSKYFDRNDSSERGQITSWSSSLQLFFLFVLSPKKDVPQNSARKQ
jgi:hypothetical protein